MRVFITLWSKKSRHQGLLPPGVSEKAHALEGHGGVHRDQSRDGADAKRDRARQRLPRAGRALDELLEGGVRREPHGGVGALPHHLREDEVYSANGLCMWGRTTGKRPR
jgi:hypothetical protein